MQGAATSVSRRKHREQLEDICKAAFGSGGMIVKSEETKSFHQGVRLAGFDGVRFVLDVTYDREEDWTPFQNSDDLASMSIEDAQHRVALLQAKRKADAEHARLVEEQERSRDRRVKLKSVFDRFVFPTLTPARHKVLFF